MCLTGRTRWTHQAWTEVGRVGATCRRVGRVGRVERLAARRSRSPSDESARHGDVSKAVAHVERVAPLKTSLERRRPSEVSRASRPASDVGRRKCRTRRRRRATPAVGLAPGQSFVWNAPKFHSQRNLGGMGPNFVEFRSNRAQISRNKVVKIANETLAWGNVGPVGPEARPTRATPPVGAGRTCRSDASKSTPDR